MTRYATAFKGLRVVKLKKKDKKIQDAIKSLRNGKLCSNLTRYAEDSLKSADIVLLAYNSEGVVKGVAGINETRAQLYVSIICNVMGKKNRGEGYAPGRGLLDLLKKIAVKKKKNLTLSSVDSAINYYKRFGFKQHPNSNYETNLMWQWNSSYSRAKRSDYLSVNSNYNSNNNKPTIYRRTRGAKRRVSPASSRASPASSSRSSASVKRTGTRKASPVSPGWQRRRNLDKEMKEHYKRHYKSLKEYQKRQAQRYKGKIISSKRSRHFLKDATQNNRNEWMTFLKNAKSTSVASKKGFAADVKRFKRSLKE